MSGVHLRNNTAKYFRFSTLVLVLCLCSLNYSFAETTRSSIDSYKVIIKTGPRKEKIKSALALADLYNEYYRKADSSLYYSKYVLGLLGNDKRSNDYANAFINISRSYYILQKPEVCLNYLDSTFNLSRSLNYSYGEYKCLYFKSLLYNDINEPDSALKFLLRALDVTKKAKNYDDLASTYNNIGELYSARKQYRKALEYDLQSLDIWEKHGDRRTGGILSDIGNCYFYLKQYDSALGYYIKSNNVNKANFNALGLGYSYNNIGLVYFKKAQYDTALKNYFIALDFYYKEGNAQGIANCLDNICKAYIAKKDYNNALKQAETALPYAFKLKDKYIAYMIYKDLSNVYEGKKDYKKAFEYQKILTAYSDSVYGMSKATSDATLQAHLAVLQKEDENQLLRIEKTKQDSEIKQQNYITILIGTFLALALGAVVYFIWNSREKARAYEVMSHQNDMIEAKNEELDKLNGQLIHQKEELETVNQFKDKLFSIISHDFRSPLVALSSYLMFLQSEDFPKEAAKELSGEMIERVNLTLTFVDNLIEWAQSQIYGVNTSYEKVNIKDVTNEMMLLYKHQSASKGVHLINNVQDTLNVYMNSGMIKMVLRNLISNSIKYSSLGDKVMVYAEEQANQTVITVEDTGSGMNKKTLNELFSPNTISQHGTAWEKGSGLGLILCKEFLEKYGGKIWVNSTEGQGSTFSFSIPNISEKNEQEIDEQALLSRRF